MSSKQEGISLCTCIPYPVCRFANVVKVDGGASFGELIGPTKASSSLFLTSTHCYLASDDKSLTIYRASPTFKFVKSLKDHEGFVQVVKGSRDGRMVGTGGADGRVFIYSSDSYEGKKWSRYRLYSF